MDATRQNKQRLWKQKWLETRMKARPDAGNVGRGPQIVVDVNFDSLTRGSGSKSDMTIQQIRDECRSRLRICAIFTQKPRRDLRRLEPVERGLMHRPDASSLTGHRCQAEKGGYNLGCVSRVRPDHVTEHASHGRVAPVQMYEMKRVALGAGDVSWLRSDMFVRLPSHSEANNFGRCAATLVCFSDTASEAVVRVAHVAVERAGRVASEELVISLWRYQNGSFEMICNRYPPAPPLTNPPASTHQGPLEHLPPRCIF
ncbi:hypothetical protein X797_008073 [Metarhizium robertsii]|uniref:Uncharacterized protein n=1 Tax=Metarhizium robertsii TaxID=568076 RepID=A0A014NBX7_9HYPO|nr:hypothetical protein X797_008073 [Metarhizium robertsii]